MSYTTKSLRSALAIFTFAALVATVSTDANAQDKPKGKPWAAPESAVKMKNPVKSDAASIAEGKELYAQHCKSCHGAKGKGDGTKAEKIDISCGDFASDEAVKATDGELYWKTTEGRKPMPSYKEKLSDNERWAIINYIRTFGKGK